MPQKPKQDVTDNKQSTVNYSQQQQQYQCIAMKNRRHCAAPDSAQREGVAVGSVKLYPQLAAVSGLEHWPHTGAGVS